MEDAFQSSSIRHLGYRDDGAMNRCTIAIRYDGCRSFKFFEEQTRLTDLLPRGPLLLPMLSYALSGYTHFDIVVVKVDRGHLDRYWRWNAQDCLCLGVSDTELWKGRLAPALGPAKLIDEGGKCRLEFHPRSHSAERDDATVNVM